MREPRLEMVLIKTDDLREHNKMEKRKLTSTYKISFFFAFTLVQPCIPLQFYQKYEILVAGFDTVEIESILEYVLHFRITSHF
jgi:hypothetical protein